jgi:hypothetical protein
MERQIVVITQGRYSDGRVSSTQFRAARFATRATEHFLGVSGAGAIMVWEEPGMLIEFHERPTAGTPSS